MNRTSLHIRKAAVTIAAIIAGLGSVGVTATLSTARFTDGDTSIGTFSSDTVKPATALSLSSPVYDKVNLSWSPSLSTYVTGYKVLRSTTDSGPWSQIGTTASRTATTFVNSGTGLTRWFYRVEAIVGNWTAAGTATQAPHAKGTFFFDNYIVSTPDINGMPTRDGASTWRVWFGGVSITQAAVGAAGIRSVAVVDTPSPLPDAQMSAQDLDGFEAFVIRGKDANNYIWVGGSGAEGVFEIAEVRNNVRTVLQTATLAVDANVRIQVVGDTITAYDGYTSVDAGGTLFMTAKTSYLLADPSARYFGIGFTGSNGSLLGDTTFQALP